jgi:hypothetical protein
MKSDVICISTFRSKPDAEKAKSVLDQAEIKSIIRPDPGIIHWGNTGGKFPESAGTQLMVRAEDLDKAREALRKRHFRSN